MNEHDQRDRVREEDRGEDLGQAAIDSIRERDAKTVDFASGEVPGERPQHNPLDERKPDVAADTSDEASYAADSAFVEAVPVTPDVLDPGDSGTPVDDTDTTAEGTTAATSSDAVATGDEAEERRCDEREQQRVRVALRAGTDEQSLKALALCREKVQQLRLRMRPLAARWEGDRHVIIFFRADEKVDFRKLVRELSRLLHARIELRQVGPREQGKLCGLVGKCGYGLCCQTFLDQFAQSTIKMAKTQELALNPMKISGICGRLLCCLNYEQEMYLEAKSCLPKVNRVVDTEFGAGRVVAVNVLKGTVTVQFETMVRELRPEQLRSSESHA